MTSERLGVPDSSAPATKARGNRSALPLLLALLLTGCAARPAEVNLHGVVTDPLLISGVTPADRAVAASLSRLVAAADSVATLWPGFWAIDTEFLVRDFAGGALLVSPRSPPGQAGRPLVGDADDPLPRNAVLVADPDAPMAIFELAYDLRGRRVFAIAPKMLPLSEEQLLLLLYHEAFHAFQAATFHWPDGHGVLRGGADARPLADAGIRAAFAVERRVLQAALLADADSSRYALLRAYLALREERRRSLPPDLAAHELAMERLEGSAQVVGYQAVAATLKQEPAHLRQLVAASLLDPRLDDLARDPLRPHGYATGAAMALLLDALDGGWRARLAYGEDFSALLAAATRFDTDSAASAADAARRAFDHEGWQRRFLGEGVVADPLADFETHEGVNVVLVGLRAEESSYRGRVSELVPRTRIFTRGTVLTLKGGAAMLESRGLAVLEDRRGSPASWVVLLTGDLEINGQPPAHGDAEYPSMLLTAEGLRVQVDTPVAVTWDGRRLVVTVRQLRGRAP